MRSVRIVYALAIAPFLVAGPLPSQNVAADSKEKFGAPNND